MPKRNRRPATSLLIPADTFKDLPDEVAAANQAAIDARQAAADALAGVKAARAENNAAENEDAERVRAALRKGKPVPPSVVREREQKHEDAKRRWSAAQALEREAFDNLADAIYEHRAALVAQVDVEARHRRVDGLLAQVDDEISRLANEAGAIRTAMTADTPSTRLKGFDAARTRADVHDTPQAHVAALGEQASELHALAERLAHGVQPEPTVFEHSQAAA